MAAPAPTRPVNDRSERLPFRQVPRALRHRDGHRERNRGRAPAVAIALPPAIPRERGGRRPWGTHDTATAAAGVRSDRAGKDASECRGEEPGGHGRSGARQSRPVPVRAGRCRSALPPSLSLSLSPSLTHPSPPPPPPPPGSRAAHTHAHTPGPRERGGERAGRGRCHRACAGGRTAGPPGGAAARGAG